MEEIVMTIVQADILPTIIVFEADVEHLELARRVVDMYLLLGQYLAGPSVGNSGQLETDLLTSLCDLPPQSTKGLSQQNNAPIDRRIAGYLNSMAM
jgi:hypothetical protein